MLLLKRLATSLVLFVFLFVVIYFGICLVGGMVNGAIAGASAHNAQQGAEAGRLAGANFVRTYLKLILLGSFGLALITSIGLSFSGVLSWCRKPLQPPPLA